MNESHPLAGAALDWVLQLDTPEDRASFERALQSDPLLKAMTGDMLDSAAALVEAIPTIPPPPSVRLAVLNRIATEPQDHSGVTLSVVPHAEVPASRRHLSMREALAWAAVLVLAGLLLMRESASSKLAQSLKSREQELLAELVKATSAEHVAKMEIDSLQSTLEEYRQGFAMVVWDPQTQQGVIKMEEMPVLAAEKDYQLWIVDPSYKNPVDGGIVRVDGQGFARVEFKAKDAVKKAEKFAISVERKGGVPVAEGPIVLLSK